VRRTLARDRVTVGDPALVRLEVGNLSRLPAPGFDAIEQVDGLPLRVRVPMLAARANQTLQLPIATTRRGLLQLGPVVAERRDPLGLVRRVRPLSGQTWLWVRPPVHPARALPLGVVLDFEGRLTEQAPLGSTAFASLREYLPGDDPRHIHWRSSARTGTLIVREHVDTTEPTTAIVVDTRLGLLDSPGFEAAVEVAASVTMASRRAGQHVTLAAPGEDRYTVEQAGGVDVMDRLAALTQTDRAGAAELTRLVETARPGGSLVVISGAEPGLVARLARARRRFARVVIVQLHPEPPDAPYNPVAAAGAERDAAPATAATRRPGLVVVQAASARDATQAWSRSVAGGPA
jgi:uncharacterized protein (DUF58 family)